MEKIIIFQTTALLDLGGDTQPPITPPECSTLCYLLFPQRWLLEALMHMIGVREMSHYGTQVRTHVNTRYHCTSLRMYLT